MKKEGLDVPRTRPFTDDEFDQLWNLPTEMARSIARSQIKWGYLFAHCLTEAQKAIIQADIDEDTAPARWYREQQEKRSQPG
jgi:hypothetical protein